MLTLQALRGALPSARLAEADLPRFLTQAFGRMTADQLEVARALLEREQLVGYPRTLSALIRHVIQVILDDKLEPRDLEPAVFDRIFARPAFLAALDDEIGLDHVVLRPGELVSPEMRELVGRHLRVLPGVGPHLTMVSPTEVSCLPGLGYAVVRSAALARPMSGEEAEAVQSAWATLEEATGWPHGQSREWEARLVRIAARPNWPAAVCVEILSGMQPPRRRALWLALLGHQRLQELPETHRAGAASLSRRLDMLSLQGAVREHTGELIEIVRAAYRSCGLYSGAALGDYPVTTDDVDAYIEWVEHPDGAKSVLASRSAEQLQRLLRQMTAVEVGTLQVDIDPDEVRILRLFRDQYLAAVYRRDTSALLGVDPLLLAQSYVAEGADRGGILAGLEQLAEDARMQRELALEATKNAAEEAVVASDSVEPDPESVTSPFSALVPRVPNRPTTSPGVNPFTKSESGESPHRVPTTTPPMKMPPLPEVPPSRSRSRPSSSMSLPPLPGRPQRPRTDRPRTRPRTQPFPDMDSLPLPKPIKHEVTRAASPPMPSVLPPLPVSKPLKGEPRVGGLPLLEQDVVAPAAQAPPERALDMEHPEETSDVDETAQGEEEVAASEVSQAELDFEVSEPSSEGPSLEERPLDLEDLPLELPPVEPSPASARRHTGRLVTPGQAARFYSEAFRELQVLERDLLERGAWPSARRRVHALGEEATDLARSLGPPARSGDVDFQTALKKVELVQSYLDRVDTLMSTAPPPSPEPEMAGMLGRLSGMFKRSDDDS